MAEPSEKLAESLEVLKKIQDEGKTAIKSELLSRDHLERLVKHGFLEEVIKGWYVISSPDEKPGESTSWYASFWNFCADYLNERDGDDYFISPDHSLLLHSGNSTIPTQLIVRTTKNSNYKTSLPYQTSLFNWDAKEPKAATFVRVDGLRMMDLPSSIVYCTPSLFQSNPTDVRTALAMIKDASEILGKLLEGGHTTVAGRLAGAFRNIGRGDIADEIVKSMTAADFKVRETDPFEKKLTVQFTARDLSPYVNRIKLMWSEMRETVIRIFPPAPGIPADHEAYMKKVEELYATDAYNSLSIERYNVTPELIERVRSGNWDLANNETDKQQRDAMAARGYWLAREKVSESIRKILQGENAGKVAAAAHREWYTELFAASVAAGIINVSALAGYRNSQVYISNSKHVPLNKDAVRDAMPALFELLENEPEASVRAVLGHFIFVFIHPYMDGNGRMGRFLMNVMLASGGYPWTIIPVEKRDTYMKALEKASVGMKVDDFAEFVSGLVG